MFFESDKQGGPTYALDFYLDSKAPGWSKEGTATDPEVDDLFVLYRVVSAIADACIGLFHWLGLCVPTSPPPPHLGHAFPPFSVLGATRHHVLAVRVGATLRASCTHLVHTLFYTAGAC